MLQTPTRLANTLSDLFQRQGERARALLQILDDERDALTGGDLVAMDATAASKTAALSELEKLKASEAGLLGDLPFARSDSPLERALAWCDEQGAIRESAEDVKQLMLECDRRNRRNGLLVQHRLNYVRRAITILHAAHADTMTYGPDGIARNGGGSRLLAEG